MRYAIPLILLCSCVLARDNGPTTVWLNAPDINVAGTDLDGKKLPAKIMPDIGALLPYVAGYTRIHETLWAVQFEWPTTERRQLHIKALLAKQAHLTSRNAVPLTKVDVTEYEPGATAEDAPTPVVVKRTLRVLAGRVRFVGEKVNAAPVVRIVR